MKKLILIIFISIAILQGNSTDSTKYKFAFYPELLGLGGASLNIEYIIKDYSFTIGAGMMVNTPAFPIALYKNLLINNNITDLIGRPEIGLGYVSYLDNTRCHDTDGDQCVEESKISSGIYLCSNLKYKLAYNSGFLRYGMYIGFLKDGNNTRIWGFPTLGIVKHF